MYTEISPQQTVDKDTQLITNEINRKILYRKKSKLKSLFAKFPRLYRCMLNLLKWTGKVEIIPFEHRPCYIIDSQRLQAVFGVGTTSTANRYLNYLCGVRLIDKISQYKGHTLYDNGNRLEQGKTLINVIAIPRYTADRLKKIDDNINFFLDNNITTGNISYVTLCERGLKDIADKVYRFNKRTAPTTARERFKRLYGLIQAQIDKYEYTNMDKLYNALQGELKPLEVDRLIKIYKQQLLLVYKYKRPTKAEKEKYNLESDKWIFTEKEIEQ